MALSESELLLSVIIPVGPAETQIPQGLLYDLQWLPQATEIIFVGCHESQQSALQQSTRSLTQYPQTWLYTTVGRAAQMNAGAQQAKGQFLWFLHVDSRFEPELSDQLISNLQQYPNRLHYCLLRFMQDGPEGIYLNGVGANIRSWLFGTPFGDQGLAISKTHFAMVGGYPEDAVYGEDHLFVWYARQQGMRLKCCWQPLVTSARKYQDKGWVKLTLAYQKVWIKQAWPEFLKWLKWRALGKRTQ